MSDKTYKIIIVVLLIIIIFMGVYIYGIQKDLTLNDYFDVSGDYSRDWNNDNNQITVEKAFPLKFNQTYENISCEVIFFKGSSQIGKVCVVNDTDGGKLLVHAKAKLPEKPDNVEFNLLSGNLIDSDIEGLEYSRNFHLF